MVDDGYFVGDDFDEGRDAEGDERGIGAQPVDGRGERPVAEPPGESDAEERQEGAEAAAGGEDDAGGDGGEQRERWCHGFPLGLPRGNEHDGYGRHPEPQVLYGAESFLVTLRIFNIGSTLGMIAEWRSPNFHQQSMEEVVLLVALYLALSRGLRLPLRLWRGCGARRGRCLVRPLGVGAHDRRRLLLGHDLRRFRLLRGRLLLLRRPRLPPVPRPRPGV